MSRRKTNVSIRARRVDGMIEVSFIRRSAIGREVLIRPVLVPNDRMQAREALVSPTNALLSTLRRRATEV